jgi:hypothetical protein
LALDTLFGASQGQSWGHQSPCPPSTWLIGARIFGLLGLARHDEAIATAEMAVRLSSRQPPVLGLLGLCYGRAGSRDAAETILSELTGRSATEYITPWAFAEVCAGLDDRARALHWLERAVEQRSLIAWLSACHSPWYAGVRSTSTFRNLAQRVLDGRMTA